MSANSLVQISPGLAAAERCRPYMDKARESFLEACKKIGSEYAALADDQKSVFRKELGLSKDTIQSYAKIARKADEKLAVIQGGRAGAAPAIPPSVETWKEIVTADDKTLKLAASKGLFTDYEVTRDNVRRFKRTGQLPAIKKLDEPEVEPRETEKPKKPSPLPQIKDQLQKAETAINRAVGHVSRARALMEEHGVVNVTGPEVRALRKQFELLCAELAAADPNMLDRALKVLRGEA